MRKLENRQTDTGIEIKEFYAGKSETLYKAYLNGQCIAVGKDRVAIIRALAKKEKQ